MQPPNSKTHRKAHSRVGVIGDIHAETSVLAWALPLLQQQRVEYILATGDVADGPRQARGVMQACRMLQDAGVIMVLGNHDRWMLDNVHRDFPDATALDEIDRPTRDYLQGLPASLEIETPLGLMLFGHGLGDNDMASLYPHDHGPALSNNATLQHLIALGRYKIVLSGHTHRRMVRTISGITFINAGAIKITREPCCVLLDFEEHRVQFYDYGPDGGTGHGPVFEL